ncbi:glycosyltransferase family 4 protein [Flavobacterium sp. MFBS3-15]|uniref:glycosyltransferase family 4 protein n=1 Tax=Flavobacterium sp. MFBS3-15 TaxID=2989816 RepID=UPI002235529F|nr:glycosyltransferase family 4 protein [Flavobacterium sp. MFBS3-15]MCW4469573.1 glycosyltransferase family 4 protein [Flavobacterium sp. MFBS3-15]
MDKKKSVTFPHPPGLGGPGSFQIRFEKAIKEKGYSVSYAKDKSKPDVIFIVGGTKKLFWLLRKKLKGVPIIYRLDGINWLHRKKKFNLRSFLVNEFRNFLSKFIHAFLADYIIYQSEFVRNWWDKSGYRRHKNYTIIHNGVDLEEFKQEIPDYANRRLVILEGTIDYTPYAVRLLNELAEKLPDEVVIDLYGSFEDKSNRSKIDSRINYHGPIPRQDVSKVLSNCVYLSLDINPACPNTVSEALASGTPVAAYDTGALIELVDTTSGMVIPYGSNPWKLGYPNPDHMVNAILHIYEDWHLYSQGARQRAEKHFDIKDMTEKYQSILDKFL